MPREEPVFADFSAFFSQRLAPLITTQGTGGVKYGEGYDIGSRCWRTYAAVDGAHPQATVARG